MLPEDDTLATGGRGVSNRDGDCRNNEGPKDQHGRHAVAYSPPQRKDGSGITLTVSGPVKMGPDRPAAHRSGAAKERTPSPWAHDFGSWLAEAASAWFPLKGDEFPPHRLVSRRCRSFPVL
ncbi:UNVERIFIED_CONTAM: hypothetical protein K2H54_066896 [Gekko kuhli]